MHDLMYKINLLQVITFFLLNPGSDLSKYAFGRYVMQARGIENNAQQQLWF